MKWVAVPKAAQLSVFYLCRTPFFLIFTPSFASGTLHIIVFFLCQLNVWIGESDVRSGKAKRQENTLFFRLFILNYYYYCFLPVSEATSMSSRGCSVSLHFISPCLIFLFVLLCNRSNLSTRMNASTVIALLKLLWANEVRPSWAPPFPYCIACFGEPALCYSSRTACWSLPALCTSFCIHGGTRCYFWEREWRYGLVRYGLHIPVLPPRRTGHALNATRISLCVNVCLMFSFLLLLHWRLSVPTSLFRFRLRLSLLTHTCIHAIVHLLCSTAKRVVKEISHAYAAYGALISILFSLNKRFFPNRSILGETAVNKSDPTSVPLRCIIVFSDQHVCVFFFSFSLSFLSILS